MEAEYIAAAEAAKDTKYISTTVQKLLQFLNDSSIAECFRKPILFCDNTATIQFCKHQAENVKNRHIDVKYKFVRELYDENWFDIKYVNTKENLADILTKALTKEVFQRLRASYLNQTEDNQVSNYECFNTLDKASDSLPNVTNQEILISDLPDEQIQNGNYSAIM